MVKYVFKDGERPRIKNAADANAQVIGEAIEKIGREVNTDGFLAESVLDAARGVRHVLHKHFEWDDNVAAEAHRVFQARTLIGCIRVVSKNSYEGSTRAWLSLNTENEGRRYHPVDQIKSSVNLQMAVVQQAYHDLESFQRRYRGLTDVCELVAKAIAQLDKTRRKYESEPATAGS